MQRHRLSDDDYGYLCPSDNSAQLFSDRKWTTISNLGGAYMAARRTTSPCWRCRIWGIPPVRRLLESPVDFSIGACSGAFQGMFGDCSSGAVTRISDCTDGTSNTFLVGENSPNFNGQLVWVSGLGNWGGTTVPRTGGRTSRMATWIPPTDCLRHQLPRLHSRPCIATATSISSSHSRAGIPAAHFAFADGSVKFIKQSINMGRLLRTRHSGQGRGHLVRCLLTAEGPRGRRPVPLLGERCIGISLGRCSRIPPDGNGGSFHANTNGLARGGGLGRSGQLAARATV